MFVYGTLLEPARLEAVLGHAHRGERLRARLHGYRRVHSAEYAYPFIVPSPGQAVDGVLVLDLSVADLAALDAYEDVAEGVYERRREVVEAQGCGPRPLRFEADVYVAGVELARYAAVEAGAVAPRSTD